MKYYLIYEYEDKQLLLFKEEINRQFDNTLQVLLSETFCSNVAHFIALFTTKQEADTYMTAKEKSNDNS